MANTFQLSTLQRHVLAGLADGETLAEIAARLSLGEHALDAALRGAVTALEARSVVHAVVLYDRMTTRMH